MPLAFETKVNKINSERPCFIESWVRFFLGAVLLTLCTGPLADAFAQGVPQPKSLKEGSTNSHSEGFDYGIGSALDIFDSSGSDALYDPLTLSTLRRLKEDSQPYWEPDQIDPDRNRRAAGRALAIQGGRGLSSVLNNSELHSTYRSIRDGLSGFQDLFRYSLQSSDKGLEVSKESKGKKLLELNVEINLKQGLDPQIKLGESIRFRYDYVEQRPILEYGVKF